MRVSYRKVFNLGNYENHQIGFEDEVGEGESSADAFARVRLVVEAEHAETQKARKENDELRARNYRLREEVDRAERRLSEVRGYWRRSVSRYNEMRSMLQAHGVVVPELDAYYLPEPEPDNLDNDQVEYCPHCGDDITGRARSAWSGPEPECESGYLCPQCREFIADE